MSGNPYLPPTAEVADIERDAASLERPPNVTNGIRVLWAQLGLGLVALVVDGLTAPAEDSDDAMWIATLAGLAFTLVISGVVAMFTWYAWKGRNWARIVHLVMLILGTLTTFFVIFASSWLFPGTPVDGTEFFDVSYVGQSLLNVAGVVLLFTPSANRWYRAMRRRGMA